MNKYVQYGVIALLLYLLLKKGGDKPSLSKDIPDYVPEGDPRGGGYVPSEFENAGGGGGSPTDVWTPPPPDPEDRERPGDYTPVGSTDPTPRTGTSTGEGTGPGVGLVDLPPVGLNPPKPREEPVYSPGTGDHVGVIDPIMLSGGVTTGGGYPSAGMSTAKMTSTLDQMLNG